MLGPGGKDGAHELPVGVGQLAGTVLALSDSSSRENSSPMAANGTVLGTSTRVRLCRTQARTSASGTASK